MNLVRKYKIHKYLNLPLKDVDIKIVDKIRNILFELIVYYDDKEEKIVYCFNDDKEYTANKYLLGDSYFFKNYPLAKYLEETKIILDKNILEFLDIIYQEIKKTFLEYRVCDKLKYPTVSVLEENYENIYYSIQTYIDIFDNIQRNKLKNV